MTEAKPATDEEITAIRMTLPEQAHQMSPAALVMQLIARIDTERAARLAAEARVKRERKRSAALAAAAKALADHVKRSVNVGPLTRDPSREAKLWRALLNELVKYEAALKEPTNG